MDAADIIRESVAQVEQLRQIADGHEGLSAAVSAVKRYQSARFAATYRDLIEVDGPYQAATRFFLAELYGDADYASRDAQFSRIAGAIQRLLPMPAVATAVVLARLHVLTERLDQAMGLAWSQMPTERKTVEIDACYCDAWQLTGQRGLREQQLHLVLEVGHDLDRLTRTKGLRMVLKMMRGPAHAAGLGDLQHFLEHGFDTFAAMSRTKGGVAEFLTLVKARETVVIDTLFSDTSSSATEYLTALLQGNR